MAFDAKKDTRVYLVIESDSIPCEAQKNILILLLLLQLRALLLSAVWKNMPESLNEAIRHGDTETRTAEAAIGIDQTLQLSQTYLLDYAIASIVSKHSHKICRVHCPGNIKKVQQVFKRRRRQEGGNSRRLYHAGLYCKSAVHGAGIKPSHAFSLASFRE